MPDASSQSSASRALVRVRQGAVIGGVCGGIARYLGWDPTLTRLLYLFLTVASVGFPGTVLYVLLWILMPRDP